MDHLSWITELVEEFEIEPFPWGDEDEDRLFVSRIASLGGEPPDLSYMSDQDAEAFLWMVQNGLSSMIWQSNIPLQDRLRAIRALPGILRSFEATGGIALNHFWRGVLQLRGLMAESEPDNVSVTDAVLAALANQLEIASRSLQLSALGGLSEIGGSESREIVTARWSTLVDDEVRAYAE